MAERQIFRIYHAQDTDNEIVARARAATKQSVNLLKDNPKPDTFLGRKTQEPPDASQG